MIRPTTLEGWLAYLETLHPKAIALGLDRVALVHSRMDASLECPVVIVTGTNGKGSTCAMLEAMYRCAGHRTGLYTSPHLVRYNERVKVDGDAQSDDALIAAFNAVEDAREDVPLTYFEYGTLAALSIFARAKIEVAVLEVGLGGRLDAVNIVDADVAVVTSVDIDHVDYLGPTREDIGREKAGIFRAARPVVCADPDPPASMVAHARALGAPVVQFGRDYGYAAQDRQWQYWGPGGKRHGLPFPALTGAYPLANASTALAAIDLLRERLHVGAGAVRDGLVTVKLEGRFQVLPGVPAIVLDVAHNPHAARALAATLAAMGRFPQTIAVLGILADKDLGGVIDAMRERIDRWFVATLPGPRGASADQVVAALVKAGVAKKATRTFDDVGSAFAAARAAASETDRIVVFGSFLTVAAALAVAR
ncbi:MAG TPA: bifunctional tetrahydrofolate synthase/dihydrofolate synthase [Casimicrobiaceae bacterium]|nr:bifunctional tetrahydrofolate synthase/dihydrofolate synthase [Casimicrobiaceae bacterium]